MFLVIESQYLIIIGFLVQNILVVFRKRKVARQWRPAPLIPALGRQRQGDLWEFEASLDYKASSRTAELHRETLFRKTRGKKEGKESRGGELVYGLSLAAKA